MLPVLPPHASFCLRTEEWVATSNPAKLELSALRQRETSATKNKEGKQPPSAARALEAGQQGAGAGGDSAQALMAHLLTKAKFEGGPWDAQEASPAVAAAQTRAGDAAASDDHFSPPSPPSAAAAGARSGGAPPAAASAASDAPRLSVRNADRAVTGAVRAASTAEMDRLPGPSAEERANGRPVAEVGGRGRGRPPSLVRGSERGVNPVDVAGMLVTDIGKDLGF